MKKILFGGCNCEGDCNCSGGSCSSGGCDTQNEDGHTSGDNAQQGGE